MTTVWFSTSTPTHGRIRVPGLVGLAIDTPRRDRRTRPAAATVSTRTADGRLRSATPPPVRETSHEFALQDGR